MKRILRDWINILMNKKRAVAKTKWVLITITLCLVLPTCLSAQVDTAWVRRYNGPGSSQDCATALAIDNAGNIYVTGNSYDAGGNNDYATIKYYANGDTAWLRRYDEPGGFGIPAAMAVDTAGNVYVTGYGGVFGGDVDYVTIKYYPNGDTAWLRRYDWNHQQDYANAIAVDDSGNVCVTGASEFGYSYDYFKTIKYLPNGDTAWVRTYPEGGNVYYSANALAIDDAGYIYVTGSGSEHNSDYVTIKYYPNGDTAWVRTYTSSGDRYDVPFAIAVDSSGNVYVTGYREESGTGEDYATIKYYPNGDTAWVRTYNGPANDYDEAHAIAVDQLGNVYVTGWSLGSGTLEDYVTIKYLPNGDTAWVRRFDGTANSWDEALDLAIDNSGNVYVTGYSEDSSTDEDYATIKYDADGNLMWLMTYAGSGNDVDEANAIAVDNSGSVYVTGYSMGSSTYIDYATIKYVQPMIALSATALDFGNVVVGESADLPLVIYNLGGANLLLSNIFNNVGVFTHNWNPLDSVILPGDSLEVMVTFTPDDTLGFNDTLSIENNDRLCSVSLSGQGVPTGVEEGLVTIPKEFALRQPLPNPCRAFATIQFELPQASVVNLSVYDITGRLVSQLINGVYKAGIHEVLFDASGLSAGVYFYRLKATRYTAIEKVVITK